MKQYEKEVLQTYLDNEKAVLKKLEEVYEGALADIEDRIADLLGRNDSDLKHVVYQVEFQKSLKKQIETILDNLHNQEFENIAEYLTYSYEEGFVGTLYSLQQQGIPLVFPINQEQVAEAIQHDTKLSTNKNTKTGKLYASLGEDIADLKRKIAGEISRGFAGSMSYAKIAANIALISGIPKNNAMRIARTEMHRIQTKASMDTCYKAREKRAEVIKIWDSTLDSRTRDSHMRVDGEQKELDEKFSNGLLYPGDPNGPAAEVVNCRCALLQRAKWALGVNETKHLGNVDEMSEKRKKEIAKKLKIPVKDLKDYSKQVVPIKAKNYKDFKKQYKELWQYEGSDLQKQTEERIAGYKKNKVKNSNKGLAAKISGDGIPEHEEAKLLKTINYSDKKAVMKEINSFEASAIKESIEMACVITVDGEVYQCFGVEDRVFPDFDLKEKLYGATISHNHPIEETVFTFSTDDLNLFMEYNLEILRGCDEKYTYEFTRDASNIDEEPEEWMNFENFEHSRIIEMAKKFNIGYRRWLNE